MCDDFKNSMMSKFDMSDLERMGYFLGIEILHNSMKFSCVKGNNLKMFLSQFGKNDCNAIKNPIFIGTKLCRNDAGNKINATLFKQVIGSLMYLSETRLDLMYGVS